MSLREEDRQKNGCPSRGLGLAAAAIGVGVGAALYYFFSKRPENPSAEGASSDNWSCESPQTLYEDTDTSDDSYSTISVNTTTDTSFHDSSLSSHSSERVTTDMSFHVSSISSLSSNQEISVDEDEDATMDDDDDNNSNASTRTRHSQSSSYMDSLHSELSDYSQISHVSGDLGRNTSNYYSPARRLVNAIERTLRWRSRERRWSLEECSICFEVILRDQEVMALPCTHNFHQACILPWLQQQQTCPNCRKSVD